MTCLSSFILQVHSVSVAAGVFFFFYLCKYTPGLQITHNKDVKARSLNKTATLHRFIAVEIASG